MFVICLAQRVLRIAGFNRNADPETQYTKSWAYVWYTLYVYHASQRRNTNGGFEWMQTVCVLGVVVGIWLRCTCMPYDCVQHEISSGVAFCWTMITQTTFSLTIQSSSVGAVIESKLYCSIFILPFSQRVGSAHGSLHYHGELSTHWLSLRVELVCSVSASLCTLVGYKSSRVTCARRSCWLWAVFRGVCGCWRRMCKRITRTETRGK